MVAPTFKDGGDHPLNRAILCRLVNIISLTCARSHTSWTWNGNHHVHRGRWPSPPLNKDIIYEQLSVAILNGVWSRKNNVPITPSRQNEILSIARYFYLEFCIISHHFMGNWSDHLRIQKWRWTSPLWNPSMICKWRGIRILTCAGSQIMLTRVEWSPPHGKKRVTNWPTTEEILYLLLHIIILNCARSRATP